MTIEFYYYIAKAPYDYMTKGDF